MADWRITFLKSLLFYVEKGYPLNISIIRAKEDSKIKGIDWDTIEEESREMVLNFFSLHGRKRSEKVNYWIRNRDHVTPSFPSWMEKELSRYIDIKLLLSSLRKRTLWLRVNTLKTSEDRALRELESNGVLVERDKDFEFLYKVVESKVHVSSLGLVKDFHVILQDKASVAVVNELEAEANDELIDLSSAPGNKLSLFAMLTENKFRAVAMDLDGKRLDKERLFLKKAGVDLDRVSFILNDSRKLSMRKSAVQKVLLDAPCSSSGMIYNDPSILVSLKDRTKVDFFSRIQREILGNALEHISPSLLVYSVCSIFPDEGEKITDIFSDFLVPLKREYSPPYRGFKSVYSTRLFPFSEHAEGFYIAKFKI